MTDENQLEDSHRDDESTLRPLRTGASDLLRSSRGFESIASQNAAIAARLLASRDNSTLDAISNLGRRILVPQIALPEALSASVNSHLSDVVESALAPMRTRLSQQLSARLDGFGVDSVIASMSPVWGSMFPRIDSLIQRQLSELFVSLRKPPSPRHWPSNWHGIRRPAADVLGGLVLDEGLPLAWVPPPQVVERLLAANSPVARREVIGRHSPQIVRSCESQLDNITSSTGRKYARFTRAAAEALRSGHREAAQSLATSTLDTITRRHVGFWKDTPDKNTRPDITSLPFRDALVLGALWRAYASWRPGDPVPHSYGRHPSSHGVSARQYNLRNATLAVMHLVSLMRLLEQEGWGEWVPDGTKNRMKPSLRSR
ncbi:hypothetical protein QE377_002962 [Microbacterium sp. SORGH_AS 862]|nr:hypothetical protein [Microbacterium sp. SORGH_AS_0862]